MTQTVTTDICFCKFFRQTCRKMHSRGSQVLLVVARTPEPLPEETLLTPTQGYKSKPLLNVTKANFMKSITCMSWSPCPLLLALANLFRHSGDIHLNIGPLLIYIVQEFCKGLASYCKAETTFTFHFSILTL